MDDSLTDQIQLLGQSDAKHNWQLDGISFHQYGAEMLGSRPDYPAGKNPIVSFKK